MKITKNKVFSNRSFNNKIYYKTHKNAPKYGAESCFSFLNLNSNYLKIELHKHSDITRKEFLEYLRKMKLIFKDLEYKKEKKKYYLIMGSSLLPKGTLNSKKKTLAILTIIRFLWESHGDCYSVSFIKEFVNDNRRIETMIKFSEAFNNNKDKIYYSSGHGIDSLNNKSKGIVIQTSKEFFSKDKDSVTGYFARKESKFKPKAI
jgi:hypothetical protein